MYQEVEPEGSVNAKVILVGEAPGRQEVLKGRPFIGPAGGVLDRLMSAAGLIRADCYILNTIPICVDKKLEEYITFEKPGKQSKIGRAHV